MDTYRYREFLSLHVKPMLLLFLQACANILIPSSSHHFNHTISHFPPVMWTLFISRDSWKFVSFVMEVLFSLFCHKAENGTHLALEIKPWTWIRSWFLGKGTLWFALISSCIMKTSKTFWKLWEGATLCSLPFQLPSIYLVSSYSTFIENLLRIKPCEMLFVWAWICGKDSREDESLWMVTPSGKTFFFIDIS